MIIVMNNFKTIGYLSFIVTLDSVRFKIDHNETEQFKRNHQTRALGAACLRTGILCSYLSFPHLQGEEELM